MDDLGSWTNIFFSLYLTRAIFKPYFLFLQNHKSYTLITTCASSLDFYTPVILQFDYTYWHDTRGTNLHANSKLEYFSPPNSNSTRQRGALEACLCTHCIRFEQHGWLQDNIGCVHTLQIQGIKFAYFYLSDTMAIIWELDDNSNDFINTCITLYTYY